MAIGLIGQKCGMSRVFREDGASIPVTVIRVLPNRVTQVKTCETDGYSAIQVTTDERKASRVNKALAGHYAKAGVSAGRGLWEFPVGKDELTKADSPISVGSEFTVDLFKNGQWVDVTGVSKGKGFAGTVKRHNFAMQDATHGNSRSHRVPGSTGQNQTPGRVFKGKKMAGHMGNERCTIRHLQVVRVDAARNVLLIKGSVPGAKTGTVVVRASVKKQGEEK